MSLYCSLQILFPVKNKKRGQQKDFFKTCQIKFERKRPNTLGWLVFNFSPTYEMKNMFQNGQWLWLSWHSSHFRY